MCVSASLVYKFCHLRLRFGCLFGVMVFFSFAEKFRFMLISLISRSLYRQTELETSEKMFAYSAPLFTEKGKNGKGKGS